MSGRGRYAFDRNGNVQLGPAVYHGVGSELLVFEEAEAAAVWGWLGAGRAAWEDSGGGGVSQWLKEGGGEGGGRGRWCDGWLKMVVGGQLSSWKGEDARWSASLPQTLPSLGGPSPYRV